jgi:protein-tyrosine phosphatase
MTEKKDQISVLFVCTGNICRSPTAEGVLRKLTQCAELDEQILIESAGTISFHTGEAPDPRAQDSARKRGIDLGNLRARQINAHDFNTVDFLIALDRSHLEAMREQAPENCVAKICLLMDYAPQSDIDDVPDPYYGGTDGFEEVLDMIEIAATGLLQEIRKDLIARS